jgi:hypothetical protein
MPKPACPGSREPQAAETAAAVPPGRSLESARPRPPCDGPARACCYARLSADGWLSGGFSAERPTAAWATCAPARRSPSCVLSSLGRAVSARWTSACPAGTAVRAAPARAGPSPRVRPALPLSLRSSSSSAAQFLRGLDRCGPTWLPVGQGPPFRSGGRTRWLPNSPTFEPLHGPYWCQKSTTTGSRTHL